MATFPHTTIFCEWTSSGSVTCTHIDPEPRQTEVEPVPLVGERLLVAEAMRFLIRLDRDLREARAQFNQDWFRRVMRARAKAASRLRRRWEKIRPRPQIPLGNLRRRYHANLARYLYETRDHSNS